MSASGSRAGERQSPTSVVPWLAAAAVFYAVFLFRTRFVVDGEIHFSLFDDAMIVMRYARNLTEGYGLVWNPGGAHVEGYTNLLWLLWMAVLHLVGGYQRDTPSRSGAVADAARVARSQVAWNAARPVSQSCARN